MNEKTGQQNSSKIGIIQPGEFMPIDEYMQRRKIYEQSTCYKLSHKTRKMIHPLLWFLIKCKNRISGFKIICINSKIPKTQQPIIFSITHIGKHDIEICSEILKRHYYLLSGNFENVHGTSDGLFIELNGIVYLNKYDKEDKKRSKERCVDILKNGGNIMWYPEGIWNLSPNQPVLPIPYGIIEVALRANAVILPVAIEQYEKEFIVNVGKFFNVHEYIKRFSDETDLKLAAIRDLRDAMATLKYEIWSSLPVNNRISIPNNYFDTFVNARLNEWHGFTYEDVRAREFCPRGTESPQTISNLDNLIPNCNNAFLFNKRLK